MPKTREKMIIIDGNSLLYRAFYALPNLTTADGRPTNAVYGFSMMVLRLLEEEKPGYCAVAFDAPGGTFRHTAYADYKATRIATPDELRPQGPMARQVCEALHIPIFEVPGVEADDVVGTMARLGEQAGMDVIIVTGDNDALQLVTEHVRVLTTRRGITDTVLYDPAAVRERYGLEPWQVPHLKALIGDTSDNIPGVRGIGEKTAAKLLQQYPTIEELMAHREEIKEARVRTALENAGNQPVESHFLATIVTDVPLDRSPEDCRCTEPDRKRLRDLFGELEFRSLRKKFEDEEEQPAGVPLVALAHPLQSPEDLDALVTRARARRGLALAIPLPEARAARKALTEEDEESDGGEGRRLPDLNRLALCVDDCAYGWDRAKTASTPAQLKPLLEDSRVPKSAHDLKSLLIACCRAGIDLAAGDFDPMIADYLLNPARSSHALADVTFDHLGYELPPDDTDAALAARAVATYTLWRPLQDRLKEEGLEGLALVVEQPLIAILARMELRGVAVDVAHLRALSAVMREQAKLLEREIHALAGQEFNIGSTKQLQFVLFEKLGLQSGKKTKTGYSTGVDVLEALAAHHPIAGKILQYRELTKLRSTYTDTLPRLMEPGTGRVHTSLNQAVAATGRLSSSFPNLQNIPIRSEIGRDIRRAFVAPAGKVLVSADYSQIELRILAHVTGDAELLRAFNADEDIHVTTASALFGVPEREVNSDMRRRAKTVNFAVIYGMSDFGLARDLGVDVATAKEWISNYFARYPGVLEFKEKVLEEARAKGFVTTMLGRRRYLPEINSRNRNFREFAERAALNTPIQGTAADIIKLAMIRVDPRLDEAGLQAEMILQVHDELLFEALPAEVDRLIPLLCGAMELEDEMDLRVRLRVDVKVGPNWSDMAPPGQEPVVAPRPAPVLRDTSGQQVLEF